MKQVVATASLKRMLNERRKLRQWPAAQIWVYPSLYERILADKQDPIFETFKEAYRRAFSQALAEVIDEDPFFKAFDEALAENPDADPEAIATLLELAYPFEAPDDPRPRSFAVAPAVTIRRRSCGRAFGHRSSGNGTGNGKGGGDGGDGDGDDGANSNNHIKDEARVWARATTPEKRGDYHASTLPYSQYRAG